MSRDLSPAELEQRREAPLTHGAHSPAQIEAIARGKRRSLLRRSQLRATDLDAVALGYLRAWSRCEAQLTLLDKFMSERGSLRDMETGEPWPFQSFYTSLINSGRLALAKLEDHMRARQSDPAGALNAYIEATYSRKDGDRGGA